MPFLNRIRTLYAMVTAITLSALEPPARAQSCVTIDQPVITVGTLAPHSPPFQSLPAELRFGLAPEPGLRRILSQSEINRFLQNARTSKSVSETRDFVERSLCLIRLGRTISVSETEDAIRSAFSDRSVEIDVLELSKRLVGSGVLHFSAHQLPRALDPSAAVTWNGWFVEQDGKKRPVWARVRMREKRSILVAARDLLAGEILTLDNTTNEERFVFPEAQTIPAAAPIRLLGMVTRRPTPVHEVIARKNLTEIPAIRIGETVTVEVLARQTRLTVEGRAESNAYAGQRVSISTPFSKRIVHAVAKDKGRAVVEADHTVAKTLRNSK